MKLQNKKTRQEGNFIINKDHFECVDLDYVPLYFSLSELLDEWEDYKPIEPLIKDEKIREVIRAWAEINDVANVFITAIEDAEWGCLYWELASIEWEQSITIRFGGELPNTLKDMTTYTVEELCGSLFGKEAE